jgi:OmpA-OmpF porin, OOP family
MPRTGRPERPLATTAGPLAELAAELRHLRGAQTYRALADKTDLSPATLRTATAGERLPTWKVTLVFAAACGGDEDKVRKLWEEASAAVGRPVPVSGRPAEPPVPRPKEVANAAQLVDMMKRLRTWSGDPSLADLNRRAGGHNLLPPSTVSDMLRSQKLPRLELVSAYVRACGLADDQITAWEQAWAELRERELIPDRAAASDEPRVRSFGRVGRPLSIVIVCLALIGITLTAIRFVMGRPTPMVKLNSVPVSMPQSCTKAGPVVFVVSGRRNSPAPVLTASMQSGAATAVREGSAIGLVDLDGSPQLTVAGHFIDPGVNAAALRNDEYEYLRSLATAMEHTRASSPNANVLAALQVAGRAVRAACPHGGTIYLEDSGLQDVGPVNFRQPGMLGASAADVVAFLANGGELPDLSGMTVVLVGVGDTAPPQPPLNLSQQANLVAIWKAIAYASGATSVRVDPTPLNGPAPAHVPSVLLIPVPTEQAWTPSDSSYTFTGSGPVGFEPNTAIFRNPAGAEAALRPLAQYLAANRSVKITLTGTSARWGTLASDRAISAARAEAVKEALVSMGAPSTQIATRGLGWLFSGYINDQGPGGTLLPGPAEHNRSVIVTKG